MTTQQDSEFNQKILNIAVAIIEDWTHTIGNRTCSDTPYDILALMEDLSPEGKDRLHKQYELWNSDGRDYVKGDSWVGSGLIVGGAIELALKRLAAEIK